MTTREDLVRRVYVGHAPWTARRRVSVQRRLCVPRRRTVRRLPATTVEGETVMRGSDFASAAAPKRYERSDYLERSCSHERKVLS
jgi:hypothetical protein